MAERIAVSDEDLAREFRLLRLSGRPSEVLKNPTLRICLTTCAELRKRRLAHSPDRPADDLKRRSAGDND